MMRDGLRATVISKFFDISPARFRDLEASAERALRQGDIGILVEAAGIARSAPEARTPCHGVPSLACNRTPCPNQDRRRAVDQPHA
jgi:hypothetical protein